MRLIKKEVKYYQCDIHHLAHDAYVHSLKFKFQLSKKWQETFELDKLLLPWAIFDKESGRYLVYSHWKNLLPRCRNSEQKLSVLVWPEADEIEENAWRYVAKLLSDSMHRKEILYSLTHLLDILPKKLKDKAVSEAGGGSSLESWLFSGYVRLIFG